MLDGCILKELDQTLTFGAKRDYYVDFGGAALLTDENGGT